jgi:creatinine amidohydrolase
MYWVLSDLKWPEAEKIIKQIDLAIIPTGSIEQHGPHLPLINDYALAEAIARAAAEKSKSKVLIVPVVMAGVSEHHMKFPGTITIKSETFMSILFDVAESLKRHGVKRLVILNGHGGNTPSIQLILRRIREELGLTVSAINYWQLIPDVIDKVLESRVWGHAGEFETSVALYIYPDKVAKKKIRKPKLRKLSLPYSNPNEKVRVYLPINWEEYTDNGVLGDPTLASAEKGGILINALLDRIIQFIESFSSY